MFNYYKLLEIMNINTHTFLNFLNDVKISYHRNPYHNFTHAFDVTQTVFSFLTTMKIDQFLCNMDIFTLLVCALCHDLDHPGVNNQYLVQSSNGLAKLYKDESVLENHHFNMMWSLIKKHKILNSLNFKQIREIKESCMRVIISTDLANHFTIMERLEKQLKYDCQFKKYDVETIRKSTKNYNYDDRILIMEAIIHASDISNVSKSWDCCKEWSTKITQELLLQGRMEKLIGLPISSRFFCLDDTPTTTDNVECYSKNTAENCLKFIEIFAEPLFTTLVKAFPETNVCLDNLKQNKLNWQKIKSLKL